MFEVLAYVYDHYWQGDSCPTLPTLQRQLRQLGFDDTEVVNALLWLEELKRASQSWQPTAAPACLPNAHATDAMRVLTPAEQLRLTPQSWAYLLFLVSVDALPMQRFELVMDRVLACAPEPLALDEFKLVVLMVFWSLGEEPSALVLDDLCDNSSARTAH